MLEHRTGTREEWLAARQELLDAEKRQTRQSDEIACMRLELPWVRIDKEYVFATDAGEKSLAELFDARSQLLVYHFMFGYGARLTEERQGCVGCSFIADHFDGILPHLNGRGVTLVCASIAPLDQLEGYKKQMGWQFPWVSSLGSDFNYDFGVAFTEEQQRNGADYNFRHVDEPLPQREGVSAFALQNGVVHHTYSAYNRGVEALLGTYQYLDLAPGGVTRTCSSTRRHRGAATTSMASPSNNPGRPLPVGGGLRTRSGSRPGCSTPPTHFGAAIGTAIALSVAASGASSLLRTGDGARVALAGGFHQTFWVLGVIALLAPPAVFALMRRERARSAAAASKNAEASRALAITN